MFSGWYSACASERTTSDSTKGRSAASLTLRRDGGEIARAQLLGNLHLDAEHAQRRRELLELALLRRLVHAIQRRPRAPLLQLPRRGDVGERSCIPRSACARRCVSGTRSRAPARPRSMHELRLRCVEVQRAAPVRAPSAARGRRSTSGSSFSASAPERRARGRVAPEQHRMRRGVGEPRGRAHHGRIEAPAACSAPRSLTLHVGHHAQAIDVRLERAQVVRQRGRQHRQHARREIDRGAARARLGIQRRARPHVMADVGDRDQQAEARRPARSA